MQKQQFEEEETELDSIKQLEDQFQFKNKTIQQIQWILDESLYERQKDTIQELSELDTQIKKLVGKLERLDRKYQEFQGMIEAHTEHISILTRETQTIESYDEMLQLRVNNQVKLHEALKIMLQGVELTPQEKNCLQNPIFEGDGIKQIENLLERIIQFKKFSSDKSNNIRAVREQIAKIQDYLNVFSSKFKENLKKQSKKILISETTSGTPDLQDENGKQLKLLDTASYRRFLMTQRRIIAFLVDSQSQQDRMMMAEIGANLQNMMQNASVTLENSWNINMKDFILFNNKISFLNAGEKITISQDDNTFLVLTQGLKSFGFVDMFKQLVEQMSTQVSQDESYWEKYFKFNKEETEDETLQRQSLVINFLSRVYAPIFKKIIDLIIGACQLSNFFPYLIEESFSKDQEDLEKESQSYKSFRLGLLNQVEETRKDQIRNYEIYLKNTDANPRHCGVLMPIKNLVVKKLTYKLTTQICIKLMCNFLEEQNSFYRDITYIYTKTFEWLKQIASKKQKYTDIVLTANLGFIVAYLDKIPNQSLKELTIKASGLYRKSSQDYASYIFCYQFMKFCDLWFKIKDIKPSELEAQKFNSSSFLKLITSSFSGFPKSVDQMLKRMNKQLAKDQDLIKRQMKVLSEYILEEFNQIDRFCQRAIGQRTNPNRETIASVLQQKGF